MTHPVVKAFQTLHRKVTNLAKNIAQSSPYSMDKCTDSIPYGIPVSPKQLILIGRNAYVVGYDPAAKIPAWVSYVLTPDHTMGKIKRSNAFAQDFSLSIENRSTNRDYEGVGYDKGHNSPDDDNNWAVVPERESFILSNMTPQCPDLNRGIWKVLETHVRAWAYDRKHPLCIYTGPIYSNTSKKIGQGNVVVPNSYFKIVIDAAALDYLAFMYDNIPYHNNDISVGQFTMSDVEAKTGLSFPVPNGLDKTSKSVIWTADIQTFDRLHNQAHILNPPA